MATEYQYVSLSESAAHLQRHFSGALTVGSKFFPEAQQMVVDLVETALMRKFLEAQDAGKPAGRVIINLEFPEAVGTDALVVLKDHNDKNQVRIIRDLGTPVQSTVTAVQTSVAPETKIVTVVAGPYGATGKWGIFTMFPGAEAPPFPHENQPDLVRQENEKFWSEHGFLATKTEIEAHPREDGKPHAFECALASAITPSRALKS